MSRLSIYLLGSFLTRDEELNRAVSFRTEKERALLAFLAVESDRGHTRDALAEMLWPDRPEGIARTNLRQALAGIRRSIGDRKTDTPFLEVTDETIRFDNSRPHWLDTQAFTRNLGQVNTHKHEAVVHCAACLEHLRQAVELYRGDFGHEFSLPKSQQFLEWAAFYRENYFRQYMVALEVLSDHHIFYKEFDQAYTLAWKQVRLAPLEEKAYRRLMRILAMTRRRSAAIEQYHACKRMLWQELGVEPAPETTRLYEQIVEGLPLDVEKPQHQPELPPLPLPLTPFFGREDELAWFARCLPNPVCRLLTLVGMPGVGKTRVALQAAKAFDADYPNSTFFIPLEQVSLPHQLPHAIATALGLQNTGGDVPTATILKRLSGQRTLLVIDGFERFLSKTGFLLQLLQGAPELKIILTSRQRLNYQAACLLRLDGLSYPARTDDARADEFPAVRLFSARAERMRAGFKVTVDNLPVIIEICKHVGGNPLGLELAAARLRENSLTEVADKIRTDLGCLATTQKDVPPVHRSMIAAILPSWERLDQDEQRVYARLSVFPGRFDLQAAEVVADANIAALTTFCEHSVLSGNAADGYQLPSLLRLFASIQLDRLPEEREQAEIAYRKVPVEDKRSNGVPDGLIRASVGMEASCDLPPAAPDSRLPTSDPLTRLPNRLLFEDRLDHALALSARKDRQLAVLVIEVLSGSGEEQVSAAATPMRLLPAIAIRIKETIRESDTLARIGEMTFGLILETLRDPADAQAVAEKIVNEIRKLYKLSELSQTRTLQIGISLFPADGTEREPLVQAASETCESVPENAAVPIKFFGKALSGES